MGDHDKGRAVRLLIDRFADRGEAVASAALGDGFNDLSMLQAVDRAFLVRRPDDGFAEHVDFPGLTRTSGQGPVGWNEAVMALLDGQNPAGADAAGKKGRVRA